MENVQEELQANKECAEDALEAANPHLFHTLCHY